MMLPLSRHLASSPRITKMLGRCCLIGKTALARGFAMDQYAFP